VTASPEHVGDTRSADLIAGYSSGPIVVTGRLLVAAALGFATLVSRRSDRTEAELATSAGVRVQDVR
jgi:hypothetical protein